MRHPAFLRHGVLLVLVCLCTLGALHQASAATRLGLQVTAEELAIWRARMTDTVNTINGFTYQSIYQNRILVDANLFRSGPTANYVWAGWTGAGCCPNDSPPGTHVRPIGAKYQRGFGVELLRSAFVYLLTGDASYANPVRTALVNQVAQAGTDWANTSKWCPSLGPPGDPVQWEITPWIVRLLLAYDFLDAGGYTGFTTQERTNIAAWFQNAATYWHFGQATRMQSSGYGAVYNEPQPAVITCVGGAVCTTPVALLYLGGPSVPNQTYNFFMGQMATVPALQVAVGIKFNNATHLSRGKKWFLAYEKVGAWDNGAVSDYGRWQDCTPSCIGSMWSHTGSPLAAITFGADLLARNGDTSLYDYNAPTQLPGTSGSVVGLQTILSLWAQLANKTVAFYGRAVTANERLTWDADADTQPKCCGHYHDFTSMAANLYYQNSAITTASARLAKASNSNVATGSLSGGCTDSQWGGCWSGSLAQWPDLPFMYGNLQGVVDPYDLGGPPPTGVTTDSTFAGYTTAVLDDGVINATGGPATTWASQDTAVDHWVLIDFGTAQNVSTVTLHWAFNAGQGVSMTSQQVLVQRWDGSAYQTVATMTPASAVASTTANFTSVSTSRLRFYQPANQGPPTYQAIMWLTEVDYGVSASDAQPVVTITNPTTSPTYTTSLTTLTTFSGSATDNIGVTGVTWTCPTCTPTSGTATCGTCGASATNVTWSVASIGLAIGNNLITVTTTDSIGQQHTDSLTVIRTSPVACYSFDGVVTDSTGLGHLGVLTNGATYGAGQVNQALLLDGTNDYVAVAHAADLNLTGNMSVDFFANHASVTDGRVVLSKDDPGGTNQAPFQLKITNPGTPRYQWYHNGGAGTFSSVFTFTGYAVPLNTWHHVAVTRDTSPTEQLTLWINGVNTQTLTQCDTCGAGTGWTDDPGSNTAGMTLGTDGSLTAGAFVQGRLDELCLYNYGLTPEEIQARAARSTAAPPVLTLSTSSGSTSTTPATVQGTATDDVGVTSITIACSPSCGSPVVTCTPTCGATATSVSWSASVPLQSGANTITVTASDGAQTDVEPLTLTLSTVLAPTVLRLVD